MMQPHTAFSIAAGAMTAKTACSLAFFEMHRAGSRSASAWSRGKLGLRLCTVTVQRQRCFVHPACCRTFRKSFLQMSCIANGSARNLLPATYALAAVGLYKPIRMVSSWRSRGEKSFSHTKLIVEYLWAVKCLFGESSLTLDIDYSRPVIFSRPKFVFWCSFCNRL